MANLSEDTVDINAVHFRNIHSTISFSSRSDALFAAFVAKHPKLPWYIIDDLLALFQNGSFLSNDVTFKCAEDIPDRIAKERRSLARVREAKQYRLSPVNSKFTNGTPMVLVELIAEQVLSERRAFVDMSGGASHFTLSMLGVPDPDETLRDMSLVHRSWTRIAQRCLRRRITAWSVSELRGLFKSPRLGPWVHELAFDEERRGGHSILSSRPSEVERLLCGIFQRCPNLKRLSIEVELLPIAGSRPTTSHRILQQLGHLYSLENLWLRQSLSAKYLSHNPKQVIDFWDFYATISKLQALKSISLSNLGFYVSSDPDIVSVHSNITPSASLQSISLLDIATNTLAEIAPMSRLIQPRNAFRPSCLDLNFDDLKIFLLGKEETMTSIIKLRVKVKNHDMEELSRVLEHCRSLSLLSLLIVGYDHLDGIHPILPTTTSNLSVYFEFPYDAHVVPLDPQTSVDLELLFLIPLLIRSSHLQEIAVYACASELGMVRDEFFPRPYLEVGAQTIPYHDTQVFCGANNIDFKLVLTERPPPFLDHTVDSEHILVDPSRPELFANINENQDNVMDEGEEEEEEEDQDEEEGQDEEDDQEEEEEDDLDEIEEDG